MNLTAMTAADLRDIAQRLINAAELADIIGAPVDLTAAETRARAQLAGA